MDGINTLLSAFGAMGDGQVRHLAYMLATAKHETAGAMLPIREWGRGQGRPYGKPDAPGQVPYGRGLVQLIWDYNYLKADKELGLNGALVLDHILSFQRKNALVLATQQAIGLTDQQLDALWQQAAAIT